MGFNISDNTETVKHAYQLQNCLSEHISNECNKAVTDLGPQSLVPVLYPAVGKICNDGLQYRWAYQ